MLQLCQTMPRLILCDGHLPNPLTVSSAYYYYYPHKNKTAHYFRIPGDSVRTAQIPTLPHREGSRGRIITFQNSLRTERKEMVVKEGPHMVPDGMNFSLLVLRFHKPQPWYIVSCTLYKVVLVGKRKKSKHIGITLHPHPEDEGSHLMWWERTEVLNLREWWCDKSAKDFKISINMK